MRILDKTQYALRFVGYHNPSTILAIAHSTASWVKSGVSSATTPETSFGIRTTCTPIACRQTRSMSHHTTAYLDQLSV